MNLRKILLNVISIIVFVIFMLTQSSVYATKLPSGQEVYMGLTELMTNDDPNMGYAIGNPNSNTGNTNSGKIWNIIKYKSSTSSEYEDGNIYCVKAGVGFTQPDNNGGLKRVAYDVYYDMKTEREEIKNQNDILKDLVEGTITENGTTINRYDALLAVFDNMYLPGESTEAEKKELIYVIIHCAAYEYNEDYAKYVTQIANAFDIPDDIEISDFILDLTEQNCKNYELTKYALTDSDINAVQQAVIWYFTNYGEENGKYDKTTDTSWLNYTLNGTDYNNLSDYNLETSEGAIRNYQAEILYRYMIEQAKANANNYTNSSSTSGAPAVVNTTKLNYTENGDNYIVGPINITENDSNSISYTIDFVVKNNGTEMSNYTLLDENKNSVENGTTVKSLVENDFYISIPKSEIDSLTVNITINYNDTTMTLWASSTNNQEQPLVEVHKKAKSNPVELTIPKGTYDLQLIKVDESEPSTKLAGAVFEITLADGTVKTLTTNAEGIIDISGINIAGTGTDTITIKETQAPKGYEKIIDKITLEVTKELVGEAYTVTGVKISSGNVTGTSASVENGVVKVTVPDRPATADFKLIKRITYVNDQAVPERIESIDASKLNTLDDNGNLVTTADYQLNKEPVGVKKGDIVTYTFRVYNEGMIDGYVQEITEDVPEGLEFLWSEKEGEELQADTTLTDEEKEAIEFNQKYLWGNFVYDDAKENIILISSDYLSKEKEVTVGGNLIKAFGSNDGSKTESDISYKEISVKFKVVSENISGKIIRNEAAITEDADENGEPVDDRDSSTDKWVKYEDDEDYDNIILQSFDLALRKFIIAVSDDTTIESSEYLKNEDGSYTRAPIVDTSKLNTLDENESLITTAIYNHTKEPVLVQPNNIVVYMLRVYNEGDMDGYAAEIKDHLPPYLEFVDGEFNKQYGWEVSEDGRTVTSRYLEDSLISKAQTDKDGKIVLTYKEVPIMCKVKEDAVTSENITNIADITEYLDENKKPVTDRDSQEDNVVLPDDKDLPSYKEDENGSYVPGQQDDDDFEKVIIKKFDLALRKWVTQAIVIENGEQTVTATGHDAWDDPEDVVKVELHRKKINQVTVKFRYSIRVYNQGEIAGYAKEVTDYIPDGLKFVAEDNPGWTDEGNNVISTRLLENTLLQPGEYADVEVILTWINNENNMGVMVNTAEISEDYNDYDLPDIDSTPDNKKPGEDDIDDAPVMLSVSTGQMRIYFTLGFIVLITTASGVILIKKFVL